MNKKDIFSEKDIFEDLPTGDYYFPLIDIQQKNQEDMIKTLKLHNETLEKQLRAIMTLMDRVDKLEKFLHNHTHNFNGCLVEKDFEGE